MMIDETKFTTSADNGMRGQRMISKISEEQQVQGNEQQDESLTDCLMEQIRINLENRAMKLTV